MLNFVYHYHAIYRNTTLGTTTHFDGILKCTERVDSMERYHDIKKAIINNDDMDATKLTICSLSLLHVKSSDAA